MLIAGRLIANRCSVARQRAQAAKERFDVADPEVRRGQRYARTRAEAVELKVPLAIQVRLRQRDAPVAIEDAVYRFAEAELEGGRDIPQTKRDRH